MSITMPNIASHVIEIYYIEIGPICFSVNRFRFIQIIMNHFFP